MHLSPPGPLADHMCLRGSDATVPLPRRTLFGGTLATAKVADTVRPKILPYVGRPTGIIGGRFAG